jgi:3-hydroxyacyl-[acyl-carrier-protein] dehydratase
VLSPDQLIDRIRALRSGPLWSAEAACDAILDIPPLERLLPHRPPFLLLDKIEQVDLSGERLRAVRRLPDEDPVFTGHFPGEPVYPGVLLIESIIQAAVCLCSLLYTNDRVDSPGKVIRVRLTHVHHAVYANSAHPGDELCIQVKMLERDTLNCCFSGQVWSRDKLCCGAMGEFYVVE